MIGFSILLLGALRIGILSVAWRLLDLVSKITKAEMFRHN